MLVDGAASDAYLSERAKQADVYLLEFTQKKTMQERVGLTAVPLLSVLLINWGTFAATFHELTMKQAVERGLIVHIKRYGLLRPTVSAKVVERSLDELPDNEVLIRCIFIFEL